jgi:hypothetical protein
MTRRLSLPAALFAAGLLAAVAHAQGNPVKPTRQWRGSVDDVSLTALARGPVVASQTELEKLWKGWAIKDAMPKVDFSKELVLVATSRGSRLNLRPVVQGDDLRAGAISTRDLRPGFRWHLVTVPRQGIKTVDGKPVPKE